MIPPHMWTELLSRAETPALRQAAADTLVLDTSHRQARLLAQPGMHTHGRPCRFCRKPIHRSVYDAQHDEVDANDHLARHEGEGPVADEDVDRAYDGLGHVWTYYRLVHRRQSIDGKGQPLNAAVHYGQAYDNAFWDGRRMVFGDGDGQLFRSFTVPVDVIGHELTHGVTGNRLAYQGQSGALNEHVSDVFGSLVKQHVLGQQAADADWLIGAGLLGPAVHGKALRSMLEPGAAYDDPQLGKDPQPAHMSGYVNTAADNGGVHINSGIPNRAFALAAVKAGGFAYDTVGRVWYRALFDRRLSPQSTFADFAAVTVRRAGPWREPVRYGWRQVGVDA